MKKRTREDKFMSSDTFLLGENCLSKEMTIFFYLPAMTFPISGGGRGEGEGGLNRRK
jgi:hypothetical protein